MNAARQRWLIALGVGLSFASRVEAEEPAFQASLSCPPVSRPGRIVCELNARASEGTLVWSDALVVRAPAFARPLRSRFVAQLGSATSGAASAKLALVASEAGEGKLELLARGVICHQGPAGEWCGPVRAPLMVELRVTANAP